MRQYCLKLLYCALAALTLSADAYAALRVAVASNFVPVLEALIIEIPPPSEITIISGATGALTNQILLGAPFDVLLAADAERPTKLAKLKTLANPACYARGQLVLSGAKAISDLKAGGRIAIANPQTAPYGRAAAEVLQRINEPSLQIIQGNNAQQAYQFKASGNVDFALVPDSLAEGFRIPTTWHSPIEQFAISVRPPGHPKHMESEAFLLWLLGEQVQSRLNHYGYSRCNHDF